MRWLLWRGCVALTTRLSDRTRHGARMRPVRTGNLRWLALPLATWLTACGGTPAGPKTIAHVDPDVRLLGAANGRVYWVRGSSLYWVDDKTPAARSARIEGGDWASRATTFIDTSGVYLVHHNKLDHIWVSGARSPAVDVRRLDAGEHPAGIVRLGDCLYTIDVDVMCTDRGAIVGWPATTAGASCPRFTVPANGLQPIAFTADARNFYWINSSCASMHPLPSPWSHGVAAVDRTTGAASMIAAFASGERAPDVLQSGTQGVYWRSSAGIRRASRGADAPVTVVEGDISDFLVDHGTLFFVRDGGVYVMDEDSARVRTIAATAGARELLVDARHVYWRNAVGDIVRAPRIREAARDDEAKYQSTSPRYMLGDPPHRSITPRAAPS